MRNHTLAHLHAHHRDFANFTQLMKDTHKVRFNPVFWGFLSKYLKDRNPRKILDLGTGPGLLLVDLARKFPNAELTGVDIQGKMLEAAKESIDSYGFSDRCSIKSFDLNKEASRLSKDLPKHDLVVASMVLHELLVPNHLLDLVKSRLNPGGLFLFYDWIRQPLPQYFGGKRPRTLDEFTHFSEHCRYSSDDLIWLIEKSGLKCHEMLTVGSGKYCLGAFSR